MSINFHLEPIESSAREVFIFWTLVKRKEGGGEFEERSEHGEAIYHVFKL